MSSRPLVIMHQDPDLAPFISRFEHNTQQRYELFESIKKQVLEGMNKLEGEKVAYWEDLEELLLRKNIIDSKDLELSYRDGVIYLEGIKKEDDTQDLLKNIVTKFIKR